MREQLWLVPGGDPLVPLRATVFRPPERAPHTSKYAGKDAGKDAGEDAGEDASSGSGRVRHPLVVINHGSDEATRVSVSMPVFYWLSKWFVDRGYVVVLPQRRGYGATGGKLAEGRDTCADPDHRSAGLAAADDIEAALRFMEAQPFIDASQTIVAGVSTGGWAALALASKNPPGTRLVINFAGGRGGHAYGQPNVVCASDRLIDAAGAYGRTSTVPTLWIYAANDTYFGPELAASMVDVWKHNGGLAELLLLGPYGSEGHDLVSDQAGWQLWGNDLERSIARAAATSRGRWRLSRGH